MFFSKILLMTLTILLSILNSIKCQKNEIAIGETWWGPDELKGRNDTSVRPFWIAFSEEMIADLRYRLKYYRPSKPTFADVGFEYGFNTREMPSWLEYWGNEYPFRQREDFLNHLPQYKTNIQGLDIHFVRVTPQVPAGVELVPLLLLHGWPGSIREFYEAIPFLTAVSADRDFVFEVVAPSLPGFGFSDAAVRPGLNAANSGTKESDAQAWSQKVLRSGWGLGGSHWLCIGYFVPRGKEVLGFHTNLALATTSRAFLLRILGSVYPPIVVDPALAARMYPLSEKMLGLLRESGYLHMQATKPDTIGIGLSDSPAGLLAYIFQMFSTGTRIYFVSREDGGLSYYPKATLIDNLMIYWVSNCISTSFRIYAETLNKNFFASVRNIPTKVPTWALQAKYEIAYQPPSILKTKYLNLLNATVLNDGGHFLALEMPKTFADDVLAAVEAFRNWHMGHIVEK